MLCVTDTDRPAFITRNQTHQRLSALYACRASHTKKYNWVKLNRRMVKNKLKQDSDIYSIYYGA